MKEGSFTSKFSFLARCIISLCIIFLVVIMQSNIGSAASKGKGYILVGDINPPWYSQLIRSAFGVVDPYEDLNKVFGQQLKKMKDMGYEVEVINVAVSSDFRRILLDPNTKALAWFGHGDPNIPGSLSCTNGDDIVPGDIADLAREALAKKIGTPDDWKSLSREERKKRYELWQNAHFNLEYAYIHSCYSLKDNSLVDVLMEDDGKFYGYVDKAYLSDSSQLAKSIRGGHRDSEITKEKYAQAKGVWSGVWTTNWGKMTLVQNGNQVTGEYEHDQGKITGHIEGNMLIGTWSEHPSYSSPRDAGSVAITISADGSTFSGKWKYGNSEGWSGNWTGTKQQ